MILTKTNKRFLTQLNFKIAFLVCALLIFSLICINAIKTVDQLLVSITVTGIVGIILYIGYRKDFIKYDSEIHEEINDNMVFKSIIFSIPIAMLITDGENIEYHNKQVRILFKQNFRTIETSNLENLIETEYAIKFKEELRNKNEQGEMIVNIKINDNQLEETTCMMKWQSIYFKKKWQYIVLFYNISTFYEGRNEMEHKLNLYESAMNKLQCSIGIFQQDGNLCFMNETCENSIGTIFNTNFKGITEFNINKNLLDTGFKIALAGDTFAGERIISINNNEEQWGHIMLIPVQTHDKINYIEYVVNDISENKRYINSLEKQLNIFSTELEKISTAVIFWDKNGNLIKANNSFYKMFDIKEGASIGTNLNLFSEKFQHILNIEELIFINENSSSSADKKRFYGNHLYLGKKILFDNLKNVKEFNCFIKLNSIGLIDKNYLKNNTEAFNKYREIWVKLNTHSLHHSDGSLISFVTSIDDVSEQFDISNKFNVTETYLKSISNNFITGTILIIDVKLNIVFVGGNDKIIKNIYSNKNNIFTNIIPLGEVSGLENLFSNITASLKGHYNKLNTIIYDNNYDFQFSPVRDNKGEITHCLVFGFDVTERASYETQLLFQKYLLDKTFSESQIPQVIINSDGQINRANQRYYQLAGITADNIYDLNNIYDKNNWLNKPEVISNFERALNGDSTQFEISESKQFSFLDDDELEDYLYVLNCRCYPIIDSNNTVINVIFNFIDVSDMRMLIENMRKSTAINEIVTENYPNGLLIVLDKNNKIVLFSGAEEIKLLELEKMKVINHIIDELEGNIFDVIKPYIEKIKLTKEKSNFDFHIDLVTTKTFQTTVYYETNVIPILDFDDELESIFICLNNITNRKQLESTILEFNTKLENEVIQRTAQLKETTYDLEVYVAELQDTQSKLVKAQEELTTNLNKELELNQMKSQFISLMSHEFRTPMTIIQTTIYLLESYYEMGMADKFEMGTQKVLYQIEQMTKLLDNVLFLDEIKEQKAAFIEINIVNYIKETIDNIVNMTNPKQEIVFKIDNENVKMYSDEKIIKQIVNNLFTNAINYSPASSKINIMLLNNEVEFTFAIQDFGNGISDDVIDRIFESFVRSQDFTNISGSGLGLSITKNCVNLLKGEIKFDTERGKGTTFYVILPKLSVPEIYDLNNNGEYFI